MSDSAPQPPTRMQRLIRRPLLLILIGSLVLHLLVGLVLGSWKIFSILTEDETEMEVVAPPAAIEPQQREYQMKTMRSQRSTALSTQIPIAVDQPSDLNLPKIDVPKPSTDQTAIKARGSASGIGGIGGGTGASGGFATLFGNTSPLAGALEGTFIDFKQDRYREKAPQEGWMEAGKDFLRNYQLREFRKFFNAPQKLYATHFYIPIISADEAPRAFGVETLVEPSQWVAVYQGQFRSERGGRFRFVGTADDILIVGVKGRTVLSAGFTESNPGKWKADTEPSFSGPPASQYLPKLTVGDWFTLAANEPTELTVLIGEIPGGEFGCYLFIEEKGVEYEKTSEGRPVLPVFKLKDFSRSDREQINRDHYPKRLDGQSFGFF
ncbi:MAG TPA: hypothetical protein DEA90_07385 [Opitutae bacterium]|mgnify:FL=1|nr:hypothetical protein [Puniceicoccaceae bacterium]HBR93973.1 hypothetical protein [Opitutae bacterium]